MKVKTLIIFLSFDCNLRCDYCYLREIGYPKMKISFKTIKKMVDYSLKYWVKKNEKLNIYFLGGEPLIEFYLIKKTVNYCLRSYGDEKIFFSITTNGTLFSKEIIHFLKKNKFQINLSMDGDKKSQNRHRKFANGKGTFNSIVKHLPLLIDYPRFKINLVVSPDNVSELVKNVVFFVNHQVKRIKIMPDLYPPLEIMWNEDLFNKFKNNLYKLIDLYFYWRKKGKKIEFFNLTMKGKDKIRETCSLNFRKNSTLMPNGDLYICGFCYFNKKERNIFLIGNVFDKDFLSKYRKYNYFCSKLDEQKLIGNKTIKQLSKDYLICFLIEVKNLEYRKKYLYFHKKLLDLVNEKAYYYYKKKAEKLGIW